MANLKSLAKDTAIYGLSSIVGRFLNYLLVPLYTAQISVASGGYGVITEIYSYTALLLVLLTFGMETAFFRFINKTEEAPCASIPPPSSPWEQWRQPSRLSCCFSSPPWPPHSTMPTIRNTSE